jgi:hypothetical protein
MTEAHAILGRGIDAPTPDGEFWHWAYHPVVLDALCRFRTAFLADCSTPARVALRGIILGALHGPKQKTLSTYFSNQCPRTYSPKPAYATRFWKSRRMRPDWVDCASVIRLRAQRDFSAQPAVSGFVRLSDSRRSESLVPEIPGQRFD